MIFLWKITNNYFAKLVYEKSRVFPNVYSFHWKIIKMRLDKPEKYLRELCGEFENNKHRLRNYKKECESEITLETLRKALKWKFDREPKRPLYKTSGKNRKEYLKDWWKAQKYNLTDYWIFQRMRPFFKKMALSPSLDEIPPELIAEKRKLIIVKQKLKRLKEVEL